MANPHEQVYIEYLNYDWDSFDEFQSGLKEILDNYLANLQEQDPSRTSIPALDRQQLVDQAKSFFYCSHTGNILNLEEFQQWKLHNGDRYDVNKKITEIPNDEPQQEPQQTGQVEPQQSGQVEPQQTDQTGNEGSEGNGSQDPPYSSNYQHVVELIVSGKPVPGIRQIPDTVLSEQSSKSTAHERVKPWEKNRKENQQDPGVSEFTS